MATTTQLRVRVPARRMKNVQAMFGRMGTDMSGAINIFLAQVEAQGRIPFDVVAIEVPNATTRAAMREAEELAKAPAYTSKKAFFAALKSKK